MPVNSKHPQYDSYSSKWKRCRDVVAGQDAVHEAGAAYLPRLTDQTETDYTAYKTRASFYNATWRTIAGLIGMMFRKPPIVEVPAAMESLLDDVTLEGTPIMIFLLQITQEALSVGRCGVLVDYPPAPINGLTQADAAALNLRPTMALYKTEAIINWQQKTINNRRVLTQVVLTEQYETVKDEFEAVVGEQFRVLDLIEGVYRQRVFRKDPNSEQIIQFGEDVFPLMGAAPLSFIPFYFIGVDTTSSTVDEPPLIDLVDLNLAHYRVTADYEHGCHFTALPTGYVTGHTKEPGEAVYLGSQSMLIFPRAETHVGFLEFSGSGLGALERNLERKEGHMAILGARMLEAQKKAAEAADTAALHRVGEGSVLASIAQSISLGFSAALQVFSDWAGASGEAFVELNREFWPKPMTPGELLLLVQAWQQGAISKETLFVKMKQGDMVPADADYETEEEKILNYMALSQGGAGE